MKPTTNPPRKMPALATKAALFGAASVVGLMTTAAPLAAQQLTLEAPSLSVTGPQVEIGAPALSAYGGSPMVAMGEEGPTVTASANRWETQFTPYVETSVTYSDNINLDPSGLEESDMAFTGTVGANYSVDNARVAGYVGYALSYDKYLENDQNDGFRHEANTAWTATLVPNLFYLDVAGGVSEVFADADDRFSENVLAGAEDRSRAYYGMISPSIQTNVGNWGVAEVRYGLQGDFYEDAAIDGGTSHNFRAQLASNPGQFRNFGWAVGTDYQIVNRDSDTDDESRWSSYASVDVPVSRTMAVTGTVGFDQYSSDLTDVGGAFGNVGVRFQPTDRMQAHAYAGYRYGGLDYGLHMNYAVGDNVVAGVAAGRAVQFSTFDEQLSGIDFDTANSWTIASSSSNNLIGGEGTGTVAPSFSLFDQDAIVDNFGGYLAGRGNRSTYGLAVQAQSRDYAPAFNDEFVIAADAEFTYDVTDRVGVELNAGLSRYDQDGTTAEDFNTLSLGAGVNYRVTDIVNVFGRYMYTQRFADQASNEFKENAATLGLNASF